MASTKSLHFKSPFLRQTWSFPDSIIYSITTNPSNAEAWQKLIQCCKYFFAKNLVFVIDELRNAGNGKWEAGFKKIFQMFYVNLCKIWLTEKFLYYAQPFNNLVSSIIPYFYRCDNKTSRICHQEITYDQFKFIFTKLEDVYLSNCVLRNKNDEIVTLEKLVKALPKTEKFMFDDNLIPSSITSNTAKELLEIPHFSKITEFFLWRLPEKFDLETFYIYFKKNKHTKFRIHFRDTISEAYKIRLEEIVDEIIAAKNHDYKIPYIYFAGLPNEKWRKIDSLIYQQNKQ